MKIQIIDEKDVLELSNEELDSSNFVEILIKQGEVAEYGICVPIDELKSAVESFELLMSRRHPEFWQPKLEKEYNKNKKLKRKRNK